MSTPPQPGFLDHLKKMVNPRTSEPVSPSFEGAPRNPGGILNKKKIVWKDAPQTSAASVSSSSPELERFVKEALPNTTEAPGAIKNFVALAKDSLMGIAASGAASGAASSVPGVGAAAGLATAGYKAYQAHETGSDVDHLKETFGATSPDLQMCSLSMARYLKAQQNDKLKHAGLDVASAGINAVLTATVLGAAAAPAVGLLKMTAEKAMAVQHLWERYRAMEQGNNLLAQAAVDPTNYYHAVEACPELAAYVLATCDPGGVSAKLGNLGLLPAQIARIRNIASDMIKESPLEIRTGEPPQSDTPLPRSAMVGGDAVGEILAYEVGRPKSAVERVSLWKKNQVVPFDASASPTPVPAPPLSPSEPRPLKIAWEGPPIGIRPPIKIAWGPTSCGTSPEVASPTPYDTTPVQPYSRSAAEALIEG